LFFSHPLVNVWERVTFRLPLTASKKDKIQNWIFTVPPIVLGGAFNNGKPVFDPSGDSFEHVVNLLESHFQHDLSGGITFYACLAIDEISFVTI